MSDIAAHRTRTNVHFSNRAAVQTWAIETGQVVPFCVPSGTLEYPAMPKRSGRETVFAYALRDNHFVLAAVIAS